ncbi:hypothetical protein AVEN_26509-1 [Araneus ventricosus]|uniref:Uncharacterized protein n=1 Tax=Araneus ventricosus TaxID=182803 RepID=A0A4Y2CUU2_ARAVE|nr:hypothetical protein AVEN_26509-1 [Araneus ventricosus]
MMFFRGNDQDDNFRGKHGHGDLEAIYASGPESYGVEIPLKICHVSGPFGCCKVSNILPWCGHEKKKHLQSSGIFVEGTARQTMFVNLYLFPHHPRPEKRAEASLGMHMKRRCCKDSSRKFLLSKMSASRAVALG